MFGDTIRVNDLNLDHNYIETIGARSFESLEPRRLYLASNRIQLIDDENFQKHRVDIIVAAKYHYLHKITHLGA